MGDGPRLRRLGMKNRVKGLNHVSFSLSSKDFEKSGTLFTEPEADGRFWLPFSAKTHTRFQKLKRLSVSDAGIPVPRRTFGTRGGTPDEKLRVLVRLIGV